MKNKNHKWTFEEVLTKFEKIEKELNLDKSTIQGVHWWDMLRLQIFNELLNELGLEKEKKKNETLTIFEYFRIKILLIVDTIKNLIKFFLPKSPLWIKKNSNIILGHPRRKLEGGIYIDPYTDPFIDLFLKKIDFCVIEGVEGNDHRSPIKTKNLFYGESLYNIAIIISKFRSFQFDENDLKSILQFEEALYNEFYYLIDIKKKVKKIIKYWLGMYPLMHLFFRFKTPKILFMVISHSREPIISAAKSLGITTIELQHGSPARGKLNYDYDSGILKKSFPEFFLSFGDYWKSNCKFPLKEKNIISFGYPYLYEKVNLYSNIVKENRLVVISQGFPILSKFAINISKHFSKKLIVEYKPHPREFNVKEQNKFIELRNAGVVISDQHADLYEIFARSKWQVGVYSTALYEGLYFGTACFILNTNGSEYMKNLVKLDLAHLISSPKDIDLNWKVNKKNLNKIFTKPSKEKIEHIISLINNQTV